MTKTKQTIVVVLGMHRSGTSALTRGLTVLGVELGESLIPANESVNAKGFWEDVDINELNIELMAALGHRWDSLTPLKAEQCLSAAALAFLPKAKALLAQKLAGHSIFGIKDPRVSVLLPFWQLVFGELELEVRYIIALRSPLSVASSLAKRDNFAPEKSHYLWLLYMLACLEHTEGRARLVVDFDQLMAEPAQQLSRVAKLLQLEFFVNDDAFNDYSQHFLDSSLRHASFSDQDTSNDVTLSDAAKSLYQLLLSLASDELDFMGDRYNKTLQKILRQFTELAPALRYLGQAEQEQAQSQAQLAQLQTHAYHLELHIKQLNDNVEGLRAHEARIEQELAQWQAVVEQQSITLVEKDRSLAEQQQALADKDQALFSQQSQLHELRVLLAQMQNSASWRLTKSLRLAKHQWRLAKPRLGKLKSLSAQAPDYVRKAGGMGAVSKKLRLIWKQEGWAGVKYRLKNRLPASIADSASAALDVEFTPGYLQANDDGQYQLIEAEPRYCYVPPAPPLNLNEQLAAMQPPILFSIVVPIYNTPADLLQKLLASVEAQWYPHWQLILADDCSPSEQIQQDLAAITHQQVETFRLEKNSGIAGATNAGIARAKGEFVVLLDHDDELTPDCLYELALCINKHNPDYIYSDEDKIDANGHYADPHFKPQWSPDTLMSTMYVCHVVCIRHTVLQQVGGLRSDYDGCQDWDLILRVTELTNNICHIPKVLYHWRVIEGSIATDISAKSYVLDASKRVREDALARRGLVGEVEELVGVPGYFRVNYQPQGTPLVSIIIPTRDNHAVLKACLDSLLQTTAYRHFEVLVIDNGSVEPETVAYLARLADESQITVIRHDRPFNFSELNNIGVQAAKGEIFLFLNDDTEVLVDDWLARMVGYAQLSHVGAVGAKLLYSGGELVQHAGVINLATGPGHAFLKTPTHSHGYYLRNQLEYNWLAVTGACLMVEREKYKAVGGFDESFPIAYNDIDLCFSLHAAGFYQVVCQAAVLLHHESVSRGHDHLDKQKQLRLRQEKQRLFTKHPAYFQHDPFYSPNLHPNGIHFQLAL